MSWGFGHGGYGIGGPPGPFGSGSMAGKSGWGFSPWGTGTYGGVPGVGLPAIYSVSPGTLEVEGGTILTIVGTNFIPELVPQVLTGVFGSYTVIAEGYLFDPNFDLTATRAIVGMPALNTGSYHLRVTTPIGLSNVLENVLIYKPHAEEVIAQKGRAGWSPKWKTGTRMGA